MASRFSGPAWPAATACRRAPALHASAPPQADAGTGPLWNVPIPEPERHPDNDSLYSHQMYKDRLRRAGYALDEMQLKLEEFGSITMSSLILARPNPMFSFELHLPAAKLYQDAKTESEGAASAQLSIATVTGIGVSVQADLDRLALAKIQLRNFATADAAFLEQQRLSREIDQNEADRIDRKYELDREGVTRSQKTAEQEFREEQQRIKAAAFRDTAASDKADLKTETDATAREKKIEEDFVTAKEAGMKLPDKDKEAALKKAEADHADALEKSDTTKKEAKAKTRADLVTARKVTAEGEKTNQTTLDNKSAQAELDLIEAERTRDASRRALNPLGTAPSRPINEGTGNVPAAAGETLVARPAELVKELEELRKATGVLPASTTLRLPNRAAIQQAAGDSAAQSLLNFLANPGEAAKFEDKVLLFGVATVGVNPGWRTKKNFAATLTTRSSFDYEAARPQVAYYVAHSAEFPSEVRAVANAQLTWEYQDHAVTGVPLGIPESYVAPKKTLLAPLVAGISPMSDSQTLDLQDDFRRQDAFAIQLALALRQQGAEGQAKVFNQFVRQQQKQAATRSSGGVVNTFSALGGLFGFQVGPRLKALADPASRSGGSANVLDRQSFPALLFFGIDRSDLLPKVRIIPGDFIGGGKGQRGGASRYELVEPVMSLVATNRWQPVNHGTFAFENWYNPFNWHKPRFSEAERMNMMIENTDARNGLKALKRMNGIANDESYSGLTEIAEERDIVLTSLVNGAVTTHRLPLELLIPQDQTPAKAIMPQLDAISPERLAVTMKNTTDVQTGFTAEIVVRGRDLDLISGVTVVIGQTVAQIISARAPSPGALVVKLKIAKLQGPLFFRLFLDPAKTKLGTEAEPFSLLSPPVFLIKAGEETEVRGGARSSCLKTSC